MRRKNLLFAVVPALALAASCGDLPPPAPTVPPPLLADGDDPPAGCPRGTFFWRVVRGDRDKLDSYRTLRDHAVTVVEEAARFPGRGGAPSPAVRLLAEVRDTFDDARRAGELEARIAYFDRVEAPAAEGIELVLTRHGSGESERRLTLTLEDLAQGGAVDGVIDRVRIAWLPGRSDGRVSIELGDEGGQIVEHVEVASEARYQVTAPQVTELYARVQRDVYKPLSGEAFVRVARAGPSPLRFRPAPPQGTSFPTPEPIIH